MWSRAGDADLAPRFFNAAATAIDIPWDIAVGNDLRHPQVQGPAACESEVHQLVYRQAAMAARHDGLLATAFLEAANLKARPERLLHPAVVARVIWGNLVRRGRVEARAVEAGAGA